MFLTINAVVYVSQNDTLSGIIVINNNTETNVTIKYDELRTFTMTAK